MSKLFEWSRGLLLEAELAAPPVVQQAVLTRFHEAKEITRMLVRPYLTLYQWQGQGHGGPLRVSYAGFGFAAPFLKSLLFAEEPVVKQEGRLSVWSLKEQLDSLPGDLIIVEASKHLTGTLSAPAAFALPLRVQHHVGVKKSWEEIQGNFRESARKNDVQRIHKFGYEYELSQRPEDFDMFYQTMYVPTMGERHGELASVSSYPILQQYLRRGFLLLIKREGRPVSAGLCSIQGKTVLIAVSGVLNADHQLRREGAVAAIHYSLIRWAHGAGYERVNLGACWPILNNGILQSKRKWGATVTIPPREHKRIWVRVQRPTPAAAQFLQDNPVVAVGPSGTLQGLIFSADPAAITPAARADWEKKYNMPGLSALCVRSVAEFAMEPGRAG